MRLRLEELQNRLLETLRERLHNGEITERGIARASGISQPHVHNVLKGTRTISPKLMDLILKSLGRSLLDFCTISELDHAVQLRRVLPEPTVDLPFISSII